MSVLHTLSATVLHGINEGPSGTNRAHLTSCLSKLNPSAFARPLPLTTLNASSTIHKSTSAGGDPVVYPIDVVTVRSSTCRESVFTEHEAMRARQRLEELQAAGMGGLNGDDVELATTMRQQQRDRNPFSSYAEPKLRRFACTSYNGCAMAPEDVVTAETDGTSASSLKLSANATSVRNRKNIFYRSPWSNLSQSIVDVPNVARALNEEVEAPHDEKDAHNQHHDEFDSDAQQRGGCGAGANNTICPIVSHYQKEAMALFSNKQLQQHRQVVESYSTRERCVAARQVEAQLNAMLNAYLDAYYVAAVEIPTAVNTTSAGGAARLGPAPSNTYGETIKTNAKLSDHDLVASAFVRDYSFERAGQPRQYFLEVNAVIRNRTKVDGDEEWAGDFDADEEGSPHGRTRSLKGAFGGRGGGGGLFSGDSTMVLSSNSNSATISNKRAAAPLLKPPHRSWTTVHTATVRQHNKEVKVAMASRLLLKQTTRGPTAAPMPDPTKAVGGADNTFSELSSGDAGLPDGLGGLDVDPIGIYGYGDGSLTGNVAATAAATNSTQMSYGAALVTARGPRNNGNSNNTLAAAAGGPSNPYPNLVIDTEAALSHVGWTSTVFQVGKDEDVLAVLPTGISQMLGDGIQAAENDALIPLLLDVLSGNTASVIRSVVPPRYAAAAAAAAAVGPTTSSSPAGATAAAAESADVVLEAKGTSRFGLGGGGPHAKNDCADDEPEYNAMENAEDRAIALRFPLATGNAAAEKARHAAVLEAAARCATVRGVLGGAKR